MTFSEQCKDGRAAAIAAINAAGDDLPKLVSRIRDVAKDETGFAVGYFYEIAERLTVRETR